MFADDLKLYKTIRSKNDIHHLQADIDAINKWCTQNMMVLNPGKCFYLNFSRKLQPSKTTYYINNVPITEVSTMRDLGVLVDSKLDFRDHIDYVIKKGARLAGFVIRQCKFFKDFEIPIVL